MYQALFKAQGCRMANKVPPHPTPDAYILIRREKYRSKKGLFQIIVIAMKKKKQYENIAVI